MIWIIFIHFFTWNMFISPDRWLHHGPCLFGPYLPIFNDRAWVSSPPAINLHSCGKASVASCRSDGNWRFARIWWPSWEATRNRLRRLVLPPLTVGRVRLVFFFSTGKNMEKTLAPLFSIWLFGAGFYFFCKPPTLEQVIWVGKVACFFSWNC